MNIFVLDNDPTLAAQAHCDRHCVKMILETAQLLSTAVRLSGIDYGYKITHTNHPSSIWVRKSLANFKWLVDLGICLCDEYSFRYNKVHKSKDIIINMPMIAGDNILTEFAQAMPDEFKIKGSAVQAYRNYYMSAKSHLLTYTNRQPPCWLGSLAKHKARDINALVDIRPSL